MRGEDLHDARQVFIAAAGENQQPTAATGAIADTT